jgi:twinfilin-like protein
MSHQTGIKSNDELRKFFAKSKEGKIRMLKVVINDREELALASHKDIKHSDWSEDYNDFVLQSIETKMPCFIFYRFDERDSEHNNSYTWLLITWTPDFAPIKQKMLYAATKSTLKLEFGAGQIKDELFCTCKDDVTLEGYQKHVKAQHAPAPLTSREEELELLKQAENHTRINVDTKHKTLQGVMFPFSQEALDKLVLFKREKLDYVKLAVDIKGEQLVLDKALEHLNSVQHLVENEIPVNTGRFHLYRFRHLFEGEKQSPAVFIYSMPGFASSVKERMLYSSTKSEILQYLKQVSQIEIVKTFEISEANELSEQVLMEELHPKKANDGLKFEKPKGPSSRGPKRVTRPASNNVSSSNGFEFEN